VALWDASSIVYSAATLLRDAALTRVKFMQVNTNPNTQRLNSAIMALDVMT
jgi:hypothetical protein